MDILAKVSTKCTGVVSILYFSVFWPRGQCGILVHPGQNQRGHHPTHMPLHGAKSLTAKYQEVLSPFCEDIGLFGCTGVFLVAHGP